MTRCQTFMEDENLLVSGRAASTSRRNGCLDAKRELARGFAGEFLIAGSLFPSRLELLSKRLKNSSNTSNH